MEASTGSPRLPAPAAAEPNAGKIKRSLIQRGVNPTPRIIHTLRKKHLQKAIRKSKRALSYPPQPQSLGEEADFQAIKAEYKSFKKFVAPKSEIRLVGKPWEGLERVRLRELAREEYAGGGGDRIKSEHLRELSDILETDRDKFRWLLDDDVEMEEGWLEEEKRNWAPGKRSRSEAETIRFLVDKLSCTELNVKDWKFSRMMKQSGLQFTEGQLLKLVEGLGDKGKWRHALSVVQWVYSQTEHRHYKSRFVFTKLLAVLGKARRTHEALQIFDLMREDCQTYPDMAAYHSIAVTLGQAGLLKKLLNIVECMREKPTKRIKNMLRKNWDPALQPDLVVFNAVLNACVPSHQWKGVSWVFEQLRKNGLKPNGVTYGLAMEVMLHSGKYDLVHEFFGKMRRSGEAPKALTYKVLVRTFWEQGKAEEAVQAVRDMEQRGVIGTACVYYELACCLCSNGRWQEALMEVGKLKKLPHTKPLEVTFTGMIKSSMDTGHIQDCISIFQHAKDHCVLDVGIVNIMLKVYGKNDMFSKAKELFEEAKKTQSNSTSSPDGYGYSLIPDVYTYSTMLEASARALQWEYFEYVYREMVLYGYLLDQSKHALLLVEASIAGKWHLLEHTFDTMLEAGEIPHPSFFTELMCQAIIRHDYERVVNIIKSMAYAPFQVSEQQWTDLLERNRDRISQDSLRDLLETLSRCDLPMEATVSNLLRSLLSHCRLDDQRGDPTADCPSLDESSLAADNGNIVDRVVDANLELGFSNHNCNGDGKAKLFPNLGDDLALEMASDEFTDDCDDELRAISLDNEEVELEIRAGDPDGTTDEESSIPSANEILKSWKQDRTRDGIFFPFI